MKRNTISTCLIGGVLAGVALLAGGEAAAIPVYSDRSVWEAAAGGHQNVSLPFANGTSLGMGSPLSLPSGDTLAFDRTVTILEVDHPSGWAGWSAGLSGFNVVAATTSDATVPVTVRGEFSSPVQAFGFDVKPNDFDVWTIKLGLSDGTMQTHLLEGLEDAGFFGWVSSNPSDLAWFEVTSEAGALGFAMGRFVQGGATIGVSDSGTTLLLLAAAGAGVVLARRRPGASAA